jgi:CrcB protein
VAGGRAVLAVIAGAIVGTGLRLLLDTVVPHSDTEFPVSTLVVNIAGAFVLGILVARVWVRPSTPGWLKAGLGPGLLGSFTTFSALVVSLVALASHGEWMLALAYLAASILLGFAAASAGLALGGRTARTTIEGADE